MLTKKMIFKVILTTITFGFLACSDTSDNPEFSQGAFSLTDSVDSEDCSESTEGSMAFVKSEATMYVCSEGEWVAMNNQEAIQFRCSSKEIKDKSGIAIICDGIDTIGIIHNGKDGSDGKDADTEKMQKEIDDALKNLSSAVENIGEDINNRFNDAYSSWTAELEDKKCEIVNTERNDDKAIITVTVKCGEAETKMEIPFTVPNENLEKKFTKHVVVRLPVESEKETWSEDLYEEVWSYLKSGKYSELSIIDLDNKYDATGKIFVTDLVASSAQPFVTVEEVNKNEVKYNVVRLEGDIDVTNLTTPIVQLRIKMNLSGLQLSNVDFVYNAIVDLTDKDSNVLDATDTIVIDFLTDYKAARVKNLLSNGRDFENALLQANDELAKALALKKDGEDYPQFEHYAPTELGLNEHFNSVLWIMALASQANLSTNVNKVYNDFRTLFAEVGNFNTPITTVFNGREQSMFFVDYLALLINAHLNVVDFCEWEENIDECLEEFIYEGYKEEYVENFYKILQKGFVDAYKLDASKAEDSDDPNYKVLKKSVKGGYFASFKYGVTEEIWIPVANSSSDINSSSSAANSSSSLSDEEILAKALGACNEEVMKDNTKNLVKVNVKEIELSTMTGYNYYKCDYVQKSGEDPFYKWVSADDNDARFQLACNAARKNDVKPIDGVHYVCREYEPGSSTSSHAWSEEYKDEFFGENHCSKESEGEIRSQGNDYKTCKTEEFYGNVLYKWSETKVEDYCRDNAKINGDTKNNITETKKIDDDEELPGQKIFDQKCEFNGTLYVRNSTGTNTNWMNAEQYISWVYSDRSGIVYGNHHYIYMDGYTEHKIYFCTYDENDNLSCKGTSVETIRGLTPADDGAAQEQLNILANMTEYKKESENLFITEVLLPGATEKTKVVASAARDDWHEFGLDDYCSINGHSEYLHYSNPWGVPSSSGSTATEDRICTADDGAKYFKAATDSDIDGYWDSEIDDANNYSGKWYSVKEYCHTKSRDCYNENEPLPASASSSAFCEFPQYHDEKIVYACDRNSGEWVELQKYCENHNDEVTYLGRQCDDDDETDCKELFNIDYLTASWSNLSCSHDSNDDPAKVSAYCGYGYYKLKDSDTWKSITCLTR